jgi:hypothetical protein
MQEYKTLAAVDLGSNSFHMQVARIEGDQLFYLDSIKELVRRWYPKVYFQLPKKSGGHRALSDIRESIAELVYYRKTVLVEAPGPTSDQAKTSAEQTQ